MKKRRIKIHLSRRVKLISAIVIVLMAALGAALYLFVVKIDKEAQSSLVAAHDSVGELTAGIKSKLTDATAPVADKIASINEYSSDLKSRADNLCSNQKNRPYSGLIATLDRCNRAEAHLRDVIATLNSISRYIEAEVAMAATVPANLGDLTFTQSYKAWNGALTSLEAINAPDELKDQKIALQKAMTDYRDAWNALSDADSARDEAAFNAADELLQKNHQALLNSVQNTAVALSEMNNKLAAQLNAYFEESKAS